MRRLLTLLAVLANLIAAHPAAATPMFSATPNPADFGNVPVGTASPPLAITISNTGNSTLHLKSFNLAGFDSADFMTMDPVKAPLTLNPNSMLPFHVVLTPSHMGAEMATVSLTTDDPMQPTAVITLTGMGVVPQLQALPMSLDFGSITVGGESAPMMVVVTNTGNSAAKIDTIKVTGNDAAQFAIDMTGPLVLAAGASATVRAKYEPMMIAPATASITFMAEGATLQVALTGTASPPSLSVGSTMLDYGWVGVGTASDAQTVAIKNTGQAPLTISGVTSSDMQFIVDQAKTSLELAPNVVTTFSVTFRPNKLGDQAGQIGISLKGAPMVASIAASGTGVQAALDMGSPSSVDLPMAGDLAGGDRSSSLDSSGEIPSFRRATGCTVASSGAPSPLAIGGIALLGAFAVLRRRRR